MSKIDRYQDHEKPFGRPSVYRPEYAEVAHKLTLEGGTLPQLAEKFKVSVTTVSKWIKKKKDFGLAIKAARLLADDMVENSLYRKALGYDKQGKHYPADTNAIRLWLMNRRPEKWREKVEHQHKHEFKAITRQIVDPMHDKQPIEDAEFTEIKDNGKASE